MVPPRQYDDLHGIDLSQLELDDIALDIEQPPSPVWRWLLALLLVGLAGFVLYFPTTSYYHTLGANSWVFFALAFGGTIVGVLLGRWLWVTLQDWAASYARRAAARPPRQRTRPLLPPAVLRWLTLLAVVGGALAIFFGPSSQAYNAGREGSDLWFLAALGAITVGILLGRWLMMQADATQRPAALRFSLRLPPWFKWVTLAVLVGGSLLALLGTSIFSDAESHSVQFGLGAVALAVGIFGAIWIAQRFDEAEERLRARSRQLRRPR